MNHVSTSAADRRQTYRLAIHHHSRIVLALDGPEPDGEAIHGVTLTDISRDGLMAADAGHLVPGVRVLLEVPLVGWREAEVRWIADNRAGCRFCEPLTLNELRLAAASSERLAGECPGLAETIARMPSIEPSRSMA
ncbi:MAG: PilZ domain-containing protein, partial [Sphingomonadales bacterium]